MESAATHHAGITSDENVYKESSTQDSSDSSSLYNASHSDTGFEPQTLDVPDTASVKSNSSAVYSRPLHQSANSSLLSSPSRTFEHGITLRQILLKGVSTQLETAQTRLGAGEATAVAVCSWIAVGMKNGLVLIFDQNQTLKWFLNTQDALGQKSSVPGGIEENEWQHAVSALAINGDSTRLLVGTARGYVLEYDLKEGKLLRTLTDVHPPEAAVLHLKFTDLPSIALLCDNGGNVFELQFKRTLGVRSVETRCVFSGSRGEVCAIEPLRCHGLDSGIIQGLRPVWESSVVVAMATLTKVHVVQIKPSTRVVHSHVLTGNNYCPPSVSWHLVVIQTHNMGRSVEPVVAFGRHDELFFYQLDVNERQRLTCFPLVRFTLEFSLRGLHWLDTRTLALLDSSLKVHIVDVKAKETVDCVDVSSANLVTAAPFFQGLATGRNVSEALALVGTETYFNSFQAYGGQVLLLSRNELRSLGLRTWTERLLHLKSQGRFEDALSLGLLMIEGKMKSIVGLRGNAQQRRTQIEEQICATYEEFLSSCLLPLLSSTSAQPTTETSRSLDSVIKTAVDFCMRLDNTYLLFDKLYPMLCDHQVANSIFLESLENYIIVDKLRNIPPSIMQQFVSHYEEAGHFRVLEQCLCHVDVTSLDLHQVLTSCQAHGLFQAWIYVYTHALADYISPLEELLNKLTEAVKAGPPYAEEDIRLGHVLLVYISCCLAGRAFPYGEIDSGLVPKIKHNVFSCLTCLHSRHAADDEPPYPYFRVLLEFNTQELFNVLSLAFQESEFSGELGARQQQRVIDILIDIMLHAEEFSPNQVCSLFTFIARHMGRNRSDAIHIDRSLFQQLLDLVCVKSAEEWNREQRIQSRHEERQQALLELLEMKDFGSSGSTHPLFTSSDEDRLLEQAENAGFFQVCEFLYRQRAQYDKVLICYLREPSRHSQIFSFIRHVLNHLNLEGGQLGNFLQTILDSLKTLIGINVQQLALLLTHQSPSFLLEAIQSLETSPQEQYLLLEALIYLRENEIFTENQLGRILLEKYVSRMAVLEPEKVAIFLQGIESTVDDKFLEICLGKGLKLAASLLYEKKGDLNSAYQLLLEDLQERIHQLFQENSLEKHQPGESWRRFNNSVDAILDFCHHSANLFDENEREKIWLTLLDAILAPQRITENYENLENKESFLMGLRDVTQRVVGSVQGQLSLSTVLRKIIEDPEAAGGNLSQLRKLIMGLLENYNYETTLLRICTRLLQGDVHSLLVDKYRTAKKAFILRNLHCSLCKSAFQQDRDSAVIFHCRHAFHASCISDGDMKTSLVCALCRPAELPIHSHHENMKITAASQISEVYEKGAEISPGQYESVLKLRQWRHSSAANLTGEHLLENSTLDEFLRLRLSPPHAKNQNNAS